MCFLPNTTIFYEIVVSYHFRSHSRKYVAATQEAVKATHSPWCWFTFASGALSGAHLPLHVLDEVVDRITLEVARARLLQASVTFLMNR